MSECDDNVLTTRIKEWGNSYGIMVPKGFLRDKKISKNEEVEVTISKKKKGNVLRETFGMAKTGKSVEKMMKEIDKELDFG